MSTLADGDAISPEQLHELLETGERFTVLDVRNRAEHEAWPLESAPETVVIPYQQFVQASVTGTVEDLAADLDGPVVAICGRGEASAHAAELLRETGIEAYNLAEGMRGWARVYVATTVSTPGPDGGGGLTVVQYRRPASGCLAYLVVSGDEAAVIDPLRAFADRYVADAREHGAPLRYAIDTHVHADHVSGVREVAAAASESESNGGPVEVVLPAGARDRGLAFDARLVDDGDVIEVGAAAIEAVHLPGHTTELTGWRVGDLLVAGDTLFVESVARPDLERGDEGAPEAARRLHATLHDRVLTRPDDVRIAPGHYSAAAERAPDGTYTARLGDLRGSLSLLALDADEFVDAVLAEMPPRPNNFERIIETNLGRASVDDDEAFEVELGPNNCAATTTAADGG
jgi:glyoxylase-like metal-dependent hydrolase (beta-lactamase superfamily II)